MSLRTRVLTLAVASALVYLPQLASAEEGAMAESSFGFNGISGLLGIVLPEGDLDTTFGLEAHANLGAPFASAPQLVFLPGLSFWSGGFDQGDASLDYREIGILADVLYVFPVGEAEGGWLLGAGGGLGMFFTSFDFPNVEFVGGQFETTTSSQSDTDIGFYILGNATKPVGEQLDILGQLRLKFDGIDTVNIHGGVQYRFAK